MASRADNSLFGARLKEARLKAGLSQKQLGIQAGLDPFVASTRINRYELGIHKADYAFSCKLAEVLRVPVAYFHAEDAELAELIVFFESAEPAIRQNIMDLVYENNQP